MKVEGKNGKLPDAKGKRFAVVSARFYPEIAEALEEGARRALRDCGAEAVDGFSVPGCFELPLAVKRVIEKGNYDGAVALGAVVRGDTPHFEFVAGECARGLMQVQLQTGVPVGFGVLTTETRAQAEERADAKRGDKGYEAAIAAATVAVLGVERETPRVGFR